MNNPEPSFGQELRRLRQAAGLSQEELAECAGLTAAAVGALERGERRYPYPHTVRALASALDLSPADRAAFLRTVPRRQSRGSEQAIHAGTSNRSRRAKPAQPLTPLIGREREIAVVRERFQQGGARLVTLTGPGGVGKTRLAMEIARRLEPTLADGFIWVDLAPVGEPNLVLATIARALGLTENTGQPIVELLEDVIESRDVLLVLDNLEHLLAATPALVRLLERCPGLSILGTSRESLGIRGEHEVSIPPLDLPVKAEASAEAIARSEAVSLFVERVRAVRPDFELTRDNAPAVAAVCTRLDGIPLAIELAAVQLKYMSLVALQHRLENQLAFLGGGLHDLPARQQSLWATVAWSHRLLTGPEQVLFRKLAVFAGGFTPEAAEAIGGAGNEPARDTIQTLSALADKNLVQTVFSPNGDVRFVMLETIRDYARELLVESGEDASIADRHAEYFCTVAEAATPKLPSAAREPWLHHLEIEMPNIRRAFAWTTTGGDPCVGLRLTGALGWFWVLRGYIIEGTRWTDDLLARSGTSCPAAIRAGALYAAAALAWKRGDLTSARHYANASVSLRRASGDRAFAFALALSGLIATADGNFDRARRFQEESLAIFRAQNDRWGIAYALANLGDALLQHGDLTGAYRHYVESLRLFTEVDDAWGRGIVLHALGNIELADGDAVAATTHYETCIALFRSIANREHVGRALVGLAAALVEQNEPAEARQRLAESIAIWHDLGNRAGMALCLEGLASIEASLGHAHGADRLIQAADTLGHGLAPPFLVDASLFARSLQAIREQHAGTAADIMSPAQAIAIALEETERWSSSRTHTEERGTTTVS